MHQPMRVNDVVLLPSARHRVVVHGDHTLMEDGFEQAGDHVVGGRVVPLRASRVGGDHTRQSIEELLHLRRERRPELVERALDVGQQVRSGEALDQRAAEVQGAQLGKGQAAARQRPERLGLDPPELGPIDRLVVDREPRFLERGEITPDRAGTTPRSVASFAIVRSRTPATFCNNVHWRISSLFRCMAGIGHERRSRAR